jgi:metal-responsive CopG/Arc/MetJ family transcriptional regulator
MRPRFSATLLYRVEPELRDAVAEHANRNMISKSEVVRQALRNYLAEAETNRRAAANSHRRMDARALA